MKLKLPSSVASPQDLASLIIEVQSYSRQFAHQSIKGQAHKGAQPALSPAAMEVIRELDSTKGLSQQSLAGLIDTLKDYAATAQSITFTLAAPATVSTKLTLVSWCRENISPNILVGFGFNATLLGGMVVRYGSHIFDWSFRRQILASRDQFPKVLRNV